MTLAEIASIHNLEIVTVRSDARVHVATLSLDGQRFTVAISTKARAPYPVEIPLLNGQRDELALSGEPLLICDYITEGTGETLSAAGWSWADSLGNAHITATGIRLRSRSSATPKRAAVLERLPKGSQAWAVIRELIESPAYTSVSSLAKASNVSQPRTSQVLSKLDSLGHLNRKQREPSDRRALLAEFLDQYEPITSANWFYSLDPPAEVASQLHQTDPEGWLSGDPAADRVAPFAIPEKTVFYTSAPTFKPPKGLVQAVDAGDGNVLIVSEYETSIRGSSADDRLVRWTQLVWDLQRLGGETRTEAANHLIDAKLAALG